MDQQTTQLSRGQITMNVTFNPDQRKDVERIKAMCAGEFDHLERIVDELCQTDAVISNGERVQRIRRLESIAKTHLETFQMLAVESLTEIEDLTYIEGVTFKDPTPGQRFMKVDFNKAEGKVSEYVSAIKNGAASIMDYLNAQALKTGKWLQTKADLKVPGEDLNIAERKASDLTATLKEALSTLRLYRLYAVKAVTR